MIATSTTAIVLSWASLICKRTVPLLAWHSAAIAALTLPAVLTKFDKFTPPALPPPICVTTKLPAAVCKSLTIPKLTGVVFCSPWVRVIVDPAAKLGAVLSGPTLTGNAASFTNPQLSKARTVIV